MISLVVWTGRQRRSFNFRWHGRFSHACIRGQGRALVLPFGDYHFGRTFGSQYKISIRRTKRVKGEQC